MNLPLTNHFSLWTLLFTSHSPKQGDSHLTSPCASLQSTAMYCHAPTEHRSISARDSSACPFPDGQHCSFPRSIPYSLLSQRQGLSQPCIIWAPFIPICCSSCRCRKCPPGPLSMSQQGNKQICDSRVAPGGTAKIMELPWAPGWQPWILPHGLDTRLGAPDLDCSGTTAGDFSLPSWFCLVCCLLAALASSAVCTNRDPRRVRVEGRHGRAA